MPSTHRPSQAQRAKHGSSQNDGASHLRTEATTADGALAASETGAGEVTSLLVPEELAGQRLDRALVTLLPQYSRSAAQEAIKAGRVLVNGRIAKPSLLLESSQRIDMREPAPVTPAAPPTGEVPPLDIIYEDEHLLVVNKAPGVVVHPAPGHESGTLVDALRVHVPGISTGEDATRPGIVHRLDKDTSGLLVVAKSGPAHAALSEQMKERSMVKRYLALVEGQMPVAEGTIEAPVGRDLRQRQRMGIVATTRGGREARTRFRVLREGRGRSLVELQLETGRTHQIRVHLAAVKHPVVGDETYGKAQPPMPPRMFLHAARLEFAHPITGEWLAFDAPLPPDLATFLAAWEGDESRP
ncbi:MAG TPA: RluA family pseudouridine synthase [Ktedonobacterales bacterium]